MNLDKACPICETSHQDSTTPCKHSAAEIDALIQQPAGAEIASAKDGESLAEKYRLSLETFDGHLIRIEDGDIVGRTGTGKEHLEFCETVSRQHARFMAEGKHWFVIDLNSSNGTFLDGIKIVPNARTLLTHGQHIQFSPAFDATVKIAVPEPEKKITFPGKDTAAQSDAHQQTLVVLFADIKGSVDYFQEMGTIIARNWVVKLFRMLSAITVAHEGKHIKDIGDAILAVFPDPCKAARAAKEMQLMIMEHNRHVDLAEQYNLRIGMNLGRVLLEDNDIFGNTVNIASRVQNLTPPGSIYITESLHAAIREERDLRSQFVGNKQLKGVKDAMGIYEIISHGENGAEQTSQSPLF